VVIAHEQWQVNQHHVGDNIDNLQGFGFNNLNMTLAGWPRGISGSANTTSVNQQACKEIAHAFLAEKEKKLFKMFQANGALGLCRYNFKEDKSYIDYDVRRGSVLLVI